MQVYHTYVINYKIRYRYVDRITNFYKSNNLGRYELIIRFSSQSVCVLGPVPNIFYILYVEYKVPPPEKLCICKTFKSYI